MRIVWIVTVGIFCAASGVAAQEPEAGGWSGKVQLSASPSLESSEVFDLRDDFVQNPEFEAKIAVTSPEIAFGQTFSLTIGSAYSPSLYTDRLAESAAFVEATLGDGPFNTHQVGELARLANSDVTDSFKFNLSYRHAEDFVEFFGASAGDTDTVGIKAAYVDVRTIWCDRKANWKPADADGPCSDVPGVSYGIEVGATRNWSSDPADDQDALSASAKVIGRPIFDAARLYGSGGLGYGRFRNVMLPMGTHRHDWTFEVGAGVDFTPLIRGPFSLEVGASQSWNRSNLDSEDAEEFVVAIALSWSHGLF